MTDLRITPPAWAADGTCASYGQPDLWFAKYADDRRQAIALCHACPMLQRCDQWATETPETWGVWGGRLRGDKKGRAL
jgi:hypothetical protein